MGRVLALVTVLSVLTAGVATPAAAQSDEALFQQMLENPGDPDAAIAFARAAEARGDIRHALAAYERVAREHPDRRDARRAYERLRLRLQPSTTEWTLQLGGAFWSNVRTNPTRLPNPADGAVEGALSVVDQRTVGRVRLKTLADAGFRAHVEEQDLTQARLGAWTGPIFALAPETTLHIAVGGAGAYLDDQILYGEVSTRVGLEVVDENAVYGAELYLAQRVVADDDPGLGDGFVAALTGRASRAGVLASDDILFFTPSIRFSQSTDGGDGGFIGEANLVADFFDYGARVSYFAPPLARSIRLGAGFGVHHRLFGRSVSQGGADRDDVLIEPTAHLIAPDVFFGGGDLRLDYRFQLNESNDVQEDYVNHVLGARLVWRF